MKPNDSIFDSYLYSSLQSEITAFNQRELIEAFALLEEKKKDFFCLGYIEYEAYLALEDSNYRSLKPLLYFGIFAQRTLFSPLKCQAFFYPQMKSFLNERDYCQKIEELKEQIACGNTYQGNFTTFFEFSSLLDSKEIFASLLHRQDTPYKALLQTPHQEIISFSPELFFLIQDRRIVTKPMKGTMPRGMNENQDKENKNFLRADSKNRSENVMIVDLLRNDLSKIATQVEVEKLFEVETYPTLFQMTSTISATLKPKLSLFEIFQALFPCGSITGAPKKNTIQILQDLEKQKRGVYCGAIGLLSNEEMIFSIPIRTITKQNDYYFYGVGSGIVWDSNPKEEYQELKNKMQFLYPKEKFCLVETMLYTPQEIKQEYLTFPQGLSFLPLHLKRLKESAKMLCFPYPHSLKKELQALNFDSLKIVRVLLDFEGNYTLEIKDYKEENKPCIRVRQKDRISDLDCHKTTLNPPIWKEYPESFDVIFYDENGILLEGSRSNLVLELDCGLVTPKYNQKFLRGVCRTHLLEKKIVQERVLKLEDLYRAKRIFCINSIRGLLEVNLI